MYVNEGYKIGVYLCSPINSTLFTECCDVAICDYEINCPNCERPVIGCDETNNHKRGNIRWNYAFNYK